MKNRRQWEKRFATPEYVFGTQPNKYLKRPAELLVAGQPALAVEDGEGRNGVWLAEKGLKVASTDFSQAALEKARKLAGSRAVEVKFEQSNLAKWDWREEAFDVVVAIFIQFAGPGLRDRISLARARH